MKLAEHIRGGQIVPWYLGYVQRDWMTHSAFFVVVPFHIPVRWGIKFWQWLRWFGREVDDHTIRRWTR